MASAFEYHFIRPDPELSIFVESIGMFGNFSDLEKDIIVLPDGRIDLIFIKTTNSRFKVLLMGLETAPELRTITPGMSAYAVSFTPLGLEYVLQSSIAGILNSARELPDNFWDNNEANFPDLVSFTGFALRRIASAIPIKVDQRKRRLFELIYASYGERSIAELSAEVGWSSRQMNRYFNSQFGLPLKAYCDILRFRKSLEHIAVGKLFPELNFTDQSHFIKEIKKYSGALPKDLQKNKDDRFVLLSVLKGK